MPKHDQPYEIGYGKPPLEGQFQPGKSGNPKGRPKGSKNLNSIVQKESRQKVRINGPYGPRSVTKIEAIIMQLVNKSAQGDLRATRDFINHFLRAEEASAGSSTAFNPSELDKPVIESILRRMSEMNQDTRDSESEK